MRRKRAGWSATQHSYATIAEGASIPVGEQLPAQDIGRGGGEMIDLIAFFIQLEMSASPSGEGRLFTRATEVRMAEVLDRNMSLTNVTCVLGKVDI
jgi:hypothetical protein